MGPKRMKNVVSDSSDPATFRPDLPPATKTGAKFYGMKLPDFQPKINLPSSISPLNAWEIFRLFIPTEIICQIVNNTNEKVAQEDMEDLAPYSRLKRWKPVTCEDIYVYIGIRIYMGLNIQSDMREYWATGQNKPHYNLSDVMAKDRFLAIHTRMRVADPDPNAEFGAVFDRLEPLNAHIRETSLKLWTPGRDVAIDEGMSPFEGRSYDTLVIKGKPIEEGYKIWILAQKGYFLTWCFHRKGKIKDNGSRGRLGPWKVPQPKALGENNSSAVVAYLMEQVPHAGYILYLDNLFTNVKLLTYMRERGVGIIGTASTKSGILEDFCEKKAKDSKKDTIPWGTLYHEPSQDGKIMFIAWKDNALVLFMTNVHGMLEMVESRRKRPSETSTSAKIVRVPFGDKPTAILEIPSLDDKYNHKMGAVDQGNKLKAEYTLQRSHRRGGHHSLITWLLETALLMPIS
ncbi:uncharacterized protein PAC_02786 [Phialocephala subalpina]|uniref:PiggyBac transposable element-derived protein domain-containing protein n=1 Tax=Phialocephala subalpina TaxID=576137 RepID=A0A1L7WJF6_9HELO|nr:uncharacterized protein PAC_02786 [Phialocephala subalpina]